MGERRYVLIEVLGAGGFGEVWRARMHGEAGFAREVAVKLLRPDVDEDAARRLRDEARLLGMIRHAGVVQVLDLTRIDGRWAVVMELVEGVSLARFTQYGQAVPTRPALEMAKGVAEVLVALGQVRGFEGQRLQVLHRDIKPSNLQLTVDGAVKVLDFGVAQARFEAREAETTGVGYGTRSYMAPERRRAGEAGPEADVFALGVVLYELISGRRFGPPPVSEQAYGRHRAQALGRLAGDEAELCSLLEAMLAFEPARRPRAEEVQGALLALLDGLRGHPSLADWARPVVTRLLAPRPGSGEVLRGVVTRTTTRLVRVGVAVGLGLVVTSSLALAAAVGVLPALPSISDWAEPAPEVQALPAERGSAAEPRRRPQPIAADALQVPVEGTALPPESDPASSRLRTEASPDQAPAPAPAGVRVGLAGDAREVTLVGDAGRFPLPGVVPPGSYRVEALFTRWGLRADVEVQISEDSRLSCSNRYGRCALE